MTGDGGTKDRWSEYLPGDLLSVIYRRCSSSYDRGRFAAVCTSWRAAASWQPKLPVLPLLLPSRGNICLDQKARTYSPEDGRVLRSWIPWFPYGKQIVGSHDGGSVATANGGRIEIVNLFARGCRVPLKGHIGGGVTIEKVIFSEDPTSEGCILAAMSRWSIAIYRVAFPGAGWTIGRYDEVLVDMAFCNGELYGLSSVHNELYGYRLCKVTVGIDEYDAVTILYNKLTMQCPEMFNPKYIFELRGKLATAVEVRSLGYNKSRIFKVLELVASSDTTKLCKYEWAEVTSLGDHAVFLGPGCCKAVYMSGMARRGEVQANHIYYSRPKHKRNDGVDPWCLDSLDLGNCVVYCYENKVGYHHLEGIVTRCYRYREKPSGIDRNSSTWILPPQF